MSGIICACTLLCEQLTFIKPLDHVMLEQILTVQSGG
jgi:hypothetical protein